MSPHLTAYFLLITIRVSVIMAMYVECFREKERCEHCGKEFPRNGHLNRHIREVHKIKLFKRIRPENPPTFHCTLVHLNVPCSAVFRSRRSLQRHKQKYNQENKPPKPKPSVLRKSYAKPSAAELEELRKNEKVNAILVSIV